MAKEKSYLHSIRQSQDYQLMIRDHADKAGQELLTLLVTINVGAFVTVIELLEDHHWLLVLFTLSTVSALLARIGVYYIYKKEVIMFQYPDDNAKLDRLARNRMRWWRGTEYTTWLSLMSFILGVVLLTGFFIADYS